MSFMRFFFIVLLFFCFQSFGQRIDLSSYLGNVVDVGGGDFGLITGAVNDSTISFVTIGDHQSDFYNGISVKFFELNVESTGYLVTKLKVGNYWLGLYQCGKPNGLKWRQDHYQYFNSTEGSLWTYLDNGVSDNKWNSFIRPITLTNITDDIATLSMGPDPVFSRGMPIFNSWGSIVGVVANAPLDENQFTFDAIDMAALEKILFGFAKCKYFQLIKYGYRSDLCTREEKAERYAQKNNLRSDRSNKNYHFTFGPAFTLSVLSLPSEIVGSSYFGTGYTAGLNLVFLPDKKTRVILKPRYSQHNTRVSDGIEKIISEFDMMELKLMSTEIPIVLDFITRYRKQGNQAISVGYSPVFLAGTEFTYSYNGLPFTRYLKPKSNLMHKILFEYTFETRLMKWGFFYSVQNNHWVDSDYKFRYKNLDYKIFEGQKAVAHSLGIEFAWRLRGNWLLKEK